MSSRGVTFLHLKDSAILSTVLLPADVPAVQILGFRCSQFIKFVIRGGNNSGIRATKKVTICHSDQEEILPKQ
jgi:hypothetical protein